MVDRSRGAGVSRLLLERLASRPARTSNNSSQRTFEQQLEKSLSGSERTATQSPVVPNRQTVANVEPARQDLGAKAAAADPIEVLKEAMRKAGIGGANVQLTVADEMVSYPGGAYRNHQIRADFGNGVTESYSVDLMMKNPWLTAFEMKRLMGSVS